MSQYLLKGKTLVCHDGCTNLAESYSVPPAAAAEYTIGAIAFNIERRAIQVRAAEPLADLELFAYYHRMFAADDLKFVYTS